MRKLAPGLLAVAMTGWLAGCAARPTLEPPPLPSQARLDPGRFLVITVRNDPQPLVVTPGSTPREYAAAGAYEVSANARAAVRAIERDYRLREVSAWPIESLRVHCVVVRIPSFATRTAMIAQLARDSRVESVQPLNEFTTEAAFPDRDPDEDSRSPPDAGSYVSLQLNLKALRVLAAHRLSKGAAVKVAIIDTGVDYRHPELRGRIVERRNFVTAGSGDFDHDRHGTEVSGVIAAASSNGQGIVGVAPESQLFALKACWPLRQNASQAACDSFTLAQALEAAIAAPVDIVNLSLVGPPDPLLSRLVKAGMQRGIIYVGAVAPRGSERQHAFPIDIPGVLRVQSAEDADGDPHELLAPGHDILTLVPGGRYDFASGSSLATAEVTGIVALLLADGRHLPAARVAAILARSSYRFETPAGPITSIDACAAVAAALVRSDCGGTSAVLRRSREAPPLASEEPVQLDKVKPHVIGVDVGRTVIKAHPGA